MLDRITPLLLTFNEEANIARTLDCLGWAREVVVLDSGSTDETIEIISRYKNVRLLTRQFDSHAKQWNFGLLESGIQTEWVLALDADYVLDDHFISGLKSIEPASEINGYSAQFRYCINGQILRGSLYPAVTVLYRREGARYFQDGHTQRISLEGKIGSLPGFIKHDDRKPLDRWLSAQVRYARLELGHLNGTSFRQLSWPDRLRLFYFLMPAMAVFYCLFIKRGILDGREGLIYAMQRSIAESILSIVLLESKLGITKRNGI
jgi:glycosyltransferase involved in cell wall biosynthesis